MVGVLYPVYRDISAATNKFHSYGFRHSRQLRRLDYSFSILQEV